MTHKTRTVLLYGNSLVISSVATSLQSQPHLSVHQINTLEIDLSQLEALNPDVLIFDLVTAQADYAIRLLSEHPQMLLIGFDPDSHQMFVWAGQHVRALTVQDLVQAINTPPGKTNYLDRVRRWGSAIAFTRNQKLALAAAAIVTGLALTAALAHPASRGLLGTVAGGGVSPELALAGIVLCGILVGVWLYLGKHRNIKKM